MTGETSRCPPRGFANAEERIPRIREDPDLVSLSFASSGGEEGRAGGGGYRAETPGTGERVRKRERERARDARVRTGPRALRPRMQARERASESGSERASFIGSVWMQFGRP